MQTLEKRKPLNGKSYGHIPHLPGSRMTPRDHKCHEGQKRICTERKRDRHDLIIVQEKLDGSNVGVARIDGMLYPLTRAGYVADTSPFEQHWRFGEWVYANQDRFLRVLKDGERVCAEWLMQAHGTRYDLSHEPFVPFDLMRGCERATYDELKERLSPYFTLPAVLNVGDSFSIESAMASLHTYGFHGALDPVEGAVWRVERKGKVDFLAKYVRPDKVDGYYLPEMSGNEAVWNWRP